MQGCRDVSSLRAATMKAETDLSEILRGFACTRAGHPEDVFLRLVSLAPAMEQSVAEAS